MSSLLRLAVLLLLALPSAAGVATPAAAAPGALPADTCRPLALDDVQSLDGEEIRQRADAATAVFVGVVSAVAAQRTGDGAGRTPGSPGATETAPADPQQTVTGWRHSVRVEHVFRGELTRGRPVEVVTMPVEQEGLGRLRRGAVYLFFAEGAVGASSLTAGACAATRLPGGLSARLRDALDAALTEEPAPAPPEVNLSEPAGDEEAPSLTRLAAPGVAVVIIGVLGLLLLARVGARR